MSLPGTRKSHAANTANSPPKYCSSRCRSRKPGKVDRQIEDAFVKLLAGEGDLPSSNNAGSGGGKEKGHKKKKGDSRILVSCDEVEKHVFGDHSDPNKAFGRRRNRARRGAPDEEEWKSVDMMSDEEITVSDASTVEEGSVPHDVKNVKVVDTTDGDLLARMAVRSGTRIRPAQEISEVNGSVGGEKGRAERIEETEEMLEKRKEGQRRAQEKEMVRCAARRGVAFGFAVEHVDDDQTEARRKCEAVMLGKVVESSFAKGDWSIRWRE